MEKKLKAIIERCKCGVHLTINGHKDYCEDIKDKLEQPHFEDVTDEIKQKIIAMDNLVEFQVYPDTSIGFFNSVSYSLDNAIDEIYSILF